MSDQKKQPVKLSAEDQGRMIRLNEEIISRIREMTMILNRNLGSDFKQEEELVFIGPKGRNNPPCVSEVPGGGCYDWCQGLCYPGPCN